MESTYEEWLKTPAGLLYIDIINSDNNGFRYIPINEINSLYVKKTIEVDSFKLINYDVVCEIMKTTQLLHSTYVKYYDLVFSSVMFPHDVCDKWEKEAKTPYNVKLAVKELYYPTLSHVRCNMFTTANCNPICLCWYVKNKQLISGFKRIPESCDYHTYIPYSGWNINKMSRIKTRAVGYQKPNLQPNVTPFDVSGYYKILAKKNVIDLWSAKIIAQIHSKLSTLFKEKTQLISIFSDLVPFVQEECNNLLSETVPL
jgi:hypothetical protein